MPRLEAICISAEKGTTKSPVPAASVRTGHGIEGDAHAGPWHRQVSVLALESIERMRAIYSDIPDGAFGENLITSGIDWRDAVVGDRLLIGDAIVLEVTQIGKECHQGCVIREKTGDCIMPREGIFCRVLSGGDLWPGDAVARKRSETETST